ncbi:PH domain-containing protein [Planosporangium thailandense]|uniref:PH domain-containing protein n=1 Tax=Planosporangium thailandense TaxID=765197 RepID=UPI0030B81AE8
MTQAIALEPAPDTIAWRRVSGRLIVIEELQVLASTVVVVAANLAARLFVHNRVPLLVAGLAAAIGLVSAVVVLRSVRTWRYAERDDDLLVRHGLFLRKLSIVPYARMQFVDVTAGPLERAFGLATVTMHTAAAASDARVPGLRAAEAARLRDRLSSLGDTRSEGL